LRHVLALALALLAAGFGRPAEAAEARGRALFFSDLPGWAEDDHSAALLAFRRSCRGRRLCEAAKRAAAEGGPAPRRFFETWFEPVEVAAQGFLTGYFEPEVPGSLRPGSAHPTPLLARPPSLVAKPARVPHGWPEGLVTARKTRGGYEAMPDREAIETGALGAAARPLVYLDPVDAFMVHVQGSARIRLADGRVLRVAFDGKNGHPYTAIGKVLATQEALPPAEVTADRLWAWLKAHPQKAPAIMRANRSYIFFKVSRAPATDGPAGAAGVPLSPGRSLAVDRRAWVYGTPVWLEGELPRPEGGTAPLRRLVVAQDTGTAIVGEARGDLYLGSGARAGAEASLIRHPVRWVVLRAKPMPRVRRGPR
jgi:membrane-bound lytic murein transglycosylase A